MIPRVYAYENLGFATQVFLEDLIIAMLVVRIGAAIGAPATVTLVACLFAAGHIPTMWANGVSFAEFGSLIFDAALGTMIIGVALRSRDIWWLWCVHYAMDMSQFERISGVAS